MERDVFVIPDFRRDGRGYVNPARLREHSEYRGDWVAYVLFKTSEARVRPSRVVITVGSLHHVLGPLHGLALKLGDVIQVRHAGSYVVLGTYAISGIVRADTGQVIGSAPDRMIRRCAG